MKILVLGSSGQIGSHLCKYLESINETVERFDIVDSLNFDLRIQNNELLNSALSKSDFVYFLAFDVGGARYLANNQDSSKFIGNNMKIMSNTFEALSNHNKPFVFASSQMSYMSDSSYGSLKRLGEKMTLDLGGVVTRFWNVYGLENDLTKSHVITDLVRCGLNTGKIHVMTDGKEVRQFLYADDCSKCLYEVSKEYNKFSRNSLDVSSFAWTSISEVAHIIAENLDITDLNFGNFKDGLQTLDPIDPCKTILDFWHPETSLELGISKIIEYERKNVHTGG